MLYLFPFSFSSFSGSQCHSSGYWAADEEMYRDKVVMVVGGGLSAVDIASDIAKTATKVLISAGRCCRAEGSSQETWKRSKQ